MTRMPLTILSFSLMPYFSAAPSPGALAALSKPVQKPTSCCCRRGDGPAAGDFGGCEFEAPEREGLGLINNAANEPPGERPEPSGSPGRFGLSETLFLKKNDTRHGNVPKPKTRTTVPGAHAGDRASPRTSRGGLCPTWLPSGPGSDTLPITIQKETKACASYTPRPRCWQTTTTGVARHAGTTSSPSSSISTSFGPEPEEDGAAMQREQMNRRTPPRCPSPVAGALPPKFVLTSRKHRG